MAADDGWASDAAQFDEGLITVNQWRERRGLAPVSWGDIPWQPHSSGDTATVEGAVTVARHSNGMVEILGAPPVTRISLELIQQSDPAVLKVSGRNITFGGQVTYEVTGWEPFSSALVAKLTDDRRPGLG